NLAHNPIKMPDLSNKSKMITYTRVYKTDIITLLHATADFNYRNRWMYGVKEVEVENHFLPRIGLRCKLISDMGESYTYSSYFSFKNDKIEFSETDEGREILFYYTLEELGNEKTKLTFDYY